ncbi:MAG: BON domain-containing protein [Desulfoferrobacter sp.]
MKTILTFLFCLTFSLFNYAPSAAVSMDSVTKSDTWLEAQLVTTYALNDSLNPFKLNVSVEKGVAHLSGTVDTPVERELAVEIAKGVDGIKEVQDNIKVQPQTQGSQTGSAQSSWYREIEDMTITAKVKTKLMWNRYTNGLNIGVSTDDGIVKLNGQVENEATRDLAGQIARNTNGVRKVVNELTLPASGSEKAESGESQAEQNSKGPGSAVETLGQVAEQVKGKVSKSMEQAGRAASDAWITAKVKTVLMFSKDTEGSDIEVSTEKGVVTLTGTVTSQAQASRVVQITRDVQDVKEVNSALVVEKSV